MAMVANMPSGSFGVMPSGSFGGYGKGMPPSGAMLPQSMAKGMPMTMPMSKGMGKGMMMSKGMHMGKNGYVEAGTDDTLWERMFGAEKEPEFVNYGSYASGPVPAPPDAPEPGSMMPIPWQKRDAPKDTKPNPAYDSSTIEQLQAMARSRNKEIESLQKEVVALTDLESHERRLAHLEQKFGGLCQGTDLKIKAPLLAKISQVVRESHLLDHDLQIQAVKDNAEEAHPAGELSPWEYMHSQNLVLGRGCMALDRAYVEKKKYKEQLEADQHPVVHRVHYAGHISAPAEKVEGIFVQESGVYKKQDLHPAPYRGGFWLNHDGPTRDDAVVAREAANLAKNDPVAQRIRRQNIVGQGEDAQGVDWLGKMKRGEMIDDRPPRNPGLVMPTWMY